MLKNTAGQVIGAELIATADGSEFTGSVTVYVTGDDGTQAAGSVGSGACTHKGNGYHSYSPAQAETNYDHVAFTFTGTGAVPVTMQVYPITGDAFTRLGAPNGASIAADIAAVKSDTAEVGAAGAGLTAVPWNAAWDAEVESEVADGLAVYDPPTKAELDSAVSPLATAAAVTTVDGNVATLLADWINGGRLDLLLDAVKAVTDNIPDSGALTSLAADITAILEDSGTTLPGLIAAIMTTQMTESYAADGVAPTPAQALLMIQQVLTEFVIAATTLTVKKLDGSTTAATLTLNDGTSPTGVTRAT